MAETVGQHSVAAFTSPVNGTSPIDANTVKGNDNTIRSAYVDHDADPGIHVQSSTLASRPVANSAGRKWMTQDSGVIRLFYDDGTSWYEVDYLRTTGGTISGNLAITGTLAVTGVATFTAQPILSSLTASRAVFTDGSKGLVSNAITGTGDVVMSASPTLTGTITAASATLSGTLGVSGLLTFASLKGTGATTVTNILDEDNMASDSATALATQQSIKAYVDAQVGASDALSEVLAIGNTTGANDIIVSAGQKIRTPAVAAQDGSSAITIANTTGALTLATALADSNLATISTAGKVSNSATTATDANTASAIVARDASGNFTAGTITAALTGNASTATTLQTARNINGVSFNGSADITVTAAAGTLTGTTLASNVTASSLTSVGTLANLTVTNPITGSVTGSSGSTTGNAATATALQTARNINGVSFNGTADITVTAAAGTLTGTTLASGVTASSLTSVGTLSSLTVSGDLTVDTDTLKVDSTNNRVGIGTATPSYRTDISNGGGSAAALRVLGNDQSNVRLRIENSGSGGRAFELTGGLTGANNSDFTLYDATAAATRLSVDASGNLGLGVTPGYKFDVQTSTERFIIFGGTGNATASAVTSGGSSSGLRLNGFPLTFGGNGASSAEHMRLDASGRLGIGTSSPGTLLSVSQNGATNNQYIQLVDTQASGVTWQIANYATNTLGMFGLYNATAGAYRLLLSGDGNLGLGVTPQTGWGANRTTFQVHATTQPNVLFTGNPTNGGAIWTNGYYDGAANRYIANGAASLFSTGNGGFQWFNAPSGTAGNTFTLTQAMTLDGLASVNQLALFANGTGTYTNLRITNANSTAGLSIGVGGSAVGAGTLQNNAYVWNTANSALSFGTNDTERARIDSSGNLLVGETTQAYLSRATFAYSASSNNGPIAVDTRAYNVTPSGAFWMGGKYNSAGNYRAFAGFGGTKANSTDGDSSGFLQFYVNKNAADPVEAARITSGGAFLVNTTSDSGYQFKVLNANSTDNTNLAFFGLANGAGTHYFFNATGTGVNTGASAMWIEKNSTTSRSINAGGTINASGADYAEYMEKAGDFTLAKGDVCGVDVNGKLTNVFADAVSFVVKSTDPSYVGGDKWGAGFKDDPNGYELARQMVDRVAFAGQVPVNVLGATPGQYIIPVEVNSAIVGQAVTNPTFEQYQAAVGKVIAIEADGRARIIVKVA